MQILSGPSFAHSGTLFSSSDRESDIFKLLKTTTLEVMQINIQRYAFIHSFIHLSFPRPSRAERA